MAAKSAIPKNLISSPFLGEHLSKRSIYVKVRPAPQNLTQRRAILKVLKQHGRIEVFKALGEPHSFISVTADATTAQNLILKAPLELSYGTTTPAQEQLEPPTTGNDHAAATHPPPPPSHSQPSNDSGAQEQKFFIDIFEATSHPHKRLASRLSPLAGPWSTAHPLTSWPSDILSSATIPGLTDSPPRAEPHEDENLLKSFARRHLEASYRDGRADLGWKGMTDWEGCGQMEGVYTEDSETFEMGWRREVLRRRWESRRRGERGEKEEGEEKEGVKPRWVVF